MLDERGVVFVGFGFGQLDVQVGHQVEYAEYRQGDGERKGELEESRHFFVLFRPALARRN